MYGAFSKESKLRLAHSRFRQAQHSPHICCRGLGHFCHGQLSQGGQFDGDPWQLIGSVALAALPGVAHVRDLHVWAMGTTETAMTAHLVMPDGGADDAFLQDATQQLHDRFGIDHVTIQATRVPFAAACAFEAPMAAESAASARTWHHDERRPD